MDSPELIPILSSLMLYGRHVLINLMLFNFIRKYVVQKIFNNPINKRHRKRVSFKHGFNMRKIITKVKIYVTYIICSKNERTGKIHFVSMWSKAAKIIIQTCKCRFTKKISREIIVLECNKGIQKW